jgi:hypothetical protein
VPREPLVTGGRPWMYMLAVGSGVEALKNPRRVWV